MNIFGFLVLRKEKMFLLDEGIRIKDFFYPMFIPNDTIISISLLDRIPKLVMKSNGANFGKIIKGFCKIRRDEFSETEKATVYLRDKNAQVIEIKTVGGSIFVNCKNDSETQELFDEMKKIVKIQKENELDYNAKLFKSKRSILITIGLVVVLLMPVFLMNYNSEIIVNDKAIEIKGEYAMNIPLSEIDTVLLVEKLPSIKLRTNGISTRKVNIGKYMMSDGNKCRLYVNNDVPLFVEIKCQKANDESQKSLIFINRKTVEETKALYEEIFNSIRN